MSNFDQGQNTIKKLDNIIDSLGPQLVSAMQSVFGTTQALLMIEKAYKDYPMLARVAASKSDKELFALYQIAAQNIAKINESNFNPAGLTELSQKLYDASYGFIEQNQQLNRIRGQWARASVAERKHFCNAVLDNLSRTFNVPRPNVYFQTSQILPVRGFMYDDTMFLSIDGSAGAPGLIVHEFTHHLQNHGKTPMGRDAFKQPRENYVLSAFLPATKRDRFKDFVMNNIYTKSLTEREAIFTGDWVKKHFKEKHNMLSPAMMMQQNQTSL
ncbi:MAG: hypothetical protein K2M34_01795 [Alphaproteobacteria bacterium]|nr:hypothetical protein [Alphaproteobacteria bacterium]